MPQLIEFRTKLQGEARLRVSSPSAILSPHKLQEMNGSLTTQLVLEIPGTDVQADWFDSRVGGPCFHVSALHTKEKQDSGGIVVCVSSPYSLHA